MTKHQFHMVIPMYIKKKLGWLIVIWGIINNTSCINMQNKVRPDAFMTRIEQSVNLLEDSVLNGWKLVCRPESTESGQYICIFSTCMNCQDSCWFSVNYDFFRKRMIGCETIIYDSTALCMAWGVDESDVEKYADSVLSNHISPIVTQITSGYRIDEMILGSCSCFSSTTNGWTVSFLTDTNGGYKLYSYFH